MILNLILSMLVIIPCDLEASQLEWGPIQHATPTVQWDVMDEEIDGYRVYYWNADEERGETWVYEPCWWYPDNEEEYGDLAGTRFCHGEILSRPVQRDISFPAAVLINLCVTAIRGEFESVNCSDVIAVCWPLTMEIP